MFKEEERILNQAGLKKTKIRLQLLKEIRESNQLYCAKDLFLNLAQKDIDADLSSVYRSLEKMVNAKVINQVNLETHKQALYELASTHHHHFLVCDTCHKVITVHHCPVEGYELELEDKYGFDVKNHKVEYHGTCTSCQKNDFK